MPEGAVAGEAERTGSSGVVEEVADQFYRERTLGRLSSRSNWIDKGVTDLFCGLWRALCRLCELEWGVLLRMGMFGCGSAGSGEWMLLDRR